MCYLSSGVDKITKNIYNINNSLFREDKELIKTQMKKVDCPHYIGSSIIYLTTEPHIYIFFKHTNSGYLSPSTDILSNLILRN